MIHEIFLLNAKALLNDSVISGSPYAQLVKKIIRSKTTALDPKVICEKHLNIKLVISNHLVPLLPLNCHALGSGKGIHDAFNSLTVEIYIEMNTKNLGAKILKEVTYVDVLYDFKFGKKMTANCIIVLMTNYTWAGLAEDVGAKMTVEKPKSCARIKLETAAERAHKMKFQSTIETAKISGFKLTQKWRYFRSHSLTNNLLLPHNSPHGNNKQKSTKTRSK